MWFCLFLSLTTFMMSSKLAIKLTHLVSVTPYFQEVIAMAGAHMKNIELKLILRIKIYF